MEYRRPALSTLGAPALSVVLLSGCSAADTAAITGFDDLSGSFDAEAKAGCDANQSLSLEDEDDGISLDGAATVSSSAVHTLASGWQGGAAEFVYSFRDFAPGDTVFLCAISSDPDHPEWEFEHAILAVAPNQSTSAWVFQE